MSPPALKASALLAEALELLKELSEHQPPVCNNDPGPWCGTCARCRAAKLIPEIERELWGESDALRAALKVRRA